MLLEQLVARGGHVVEQCLLVHGHLVAAGQLLIPIGAIRVLLQDVQLEVVVGGAHVPHAEGGQQTFVTVKVGVLTTVWRITVKDKDDSLIIVDVFCRLYGNEDRLNSNRGEDLESRTFTVQKLFVNITCLNRCSYSKPIIDMNGPCML